MGNGTCSITGFKAGYGHSKLRVVARRVGRVRAAAAKFESFRNNTAAVPLSKHILPKNGCEGDYRRCCDFGRRIRASNLDLRYDQYPFFELDNMDDDECLVEFRVRKRDISLLEEAL